MNAVIYSDGIIEMTGESILFRKYYFPFGSKRIELSRIDHIEVRTPSLLNGKWRIHGTGDFRTWFPCDAKRPERDRIFIIHLKNRWRRIGFTAEDSSAVLTVLRGRKIPVRDKSAES